MEASMIVDDQLPDPNSDAFAALVDLRIFLRERKIDYTIIDWGGDDIYVLFATAFRRYEVCFDSDFIFWSVFEGDEFAETDYEKLKARIIDDKSG